MGKVARGWRGVQPPCTSGHLIRVSVLLRQGSSNELQCCLRGTATNLLAIADEPKRKGPCRLGRRDANPDGAHGLVRRAASRPRDAGDADTEGGSKSAACSLSHLADNWLAHRAVHNEFRL